MSGVGRRQDVPHYTDAEVEAILEKALTLALDQDVPDELRAVVFDKAVNLLSAKQIVMEQVPTLGPLMAIPKGGG